MKAACFSFFGRIPSATWCVSAMALGLCALLAACAERAPRFDVPPPSLAPRYVVAVSVSGTPALVTPMGPATGAVAGALAGGYYTCVLSIGSLCPAAVAVMPVTAVAGLVSADTPRNVARAERGLKRQELTSRVAARLQEAILAAGNRHNGYRFVVAGDDEATQDARIALRVSPRAVGLNRISGKQVFTLSAEGRLEKQDFGEFSYASAPRELAAWLTDDGATTDAALTDGCRSIAEQIVGRVLEGR